jgi:hypothetical protein
MIDFSGEAGKICVGRVWHANAGVDMTVAELIEELRQYDQSSQVEIEINDCIFKSIEFIPTIVYKTNEKINVVVIKTGDENAKIRQGQC